MPGTSHVEDEIQSQPHCWAQAAQLAVSARTQLPAQGERIAVMGCGTSWFMAQSYAALREHGGHGETDAFAASEFLHDRPYDRLVAITRSGTTSEVLDVLDNVRGRIPTLALTADANTPVADHADAVIALDFADERSVVQTRFATSVLAMFRSHLGEDTSPACADAQNALRDPVPGTGGARRQFVFLGHGWTAGLAHEAALKLREASLSWSESYPAMEYRHGPISLADEHSVVWFLGGESPAGLADEVATTGAHIIADQLDPLADLVRAQRMAVELGVGKGLDPDHPRHLSRSVVLASS